MPYAREECYECDRMAVTCDECGCCRRCCDCQLALFDADELGLDPETDDERY